MAAIHHRILIAESDTPLRQALAEHLGAAGFAITAATTGPEALRLSAGQDLVLAGDGLFSDGDTLELCRQWRAEGLVVVVLGAAAPNADAVIAKPFRLGALVARLQELLARRPPPALAIGGWRFDPGARRLDGAERTVRLTDKETTILSFLHQAAGVVPREMLLAGVWGYAAGVDTHTLETHIYRLRRKLGDGLLVTEPGGYRLAIK